MSARPPAAPPKIPGFSYVRHLGSGGFADVYLYEESLLRRQVAVKVLLAGELMAEALSNFTTEANLMAQLSNHPSIVSVFQAGVSDDGRPFIVMEYCSRPNLQTRYRAGRVAEAETLRIGVQIAGAVETAHRAGILHRDIKPANILVTEYGRPALTDFGIAATTGSGAKGGLSIPWAPPESFTTGGAGDERSDVYSLAATLYTVLAGRTPFEIPGEPNTSTNVIGRIQSGALPPIGRLDVAPAVEKVLAAAMSVNPDDRHASGMEFARDLQRLQIERGMQPTTVDVVDDSADPLEREEDEGLTRIRSVVTIDAQAAEQPGLDTSVPTTLTDHGYTQKAFRPAALPLPEPPPLEETQLRAPLQPVEVPAQTSDPAAPATRSRTRAVVLVAVAAAIALIAGLVVVTTLFGQPAASARPGVTPSSEPIDPAPVSSAVPQVAKLKGVLTAGKVTFTWTNPDPQEGDSYLWRRVEPGVKHTYTQVKATKVTLLPAASGSTCIEVLLRRANGRSADEPMGGCAR
ncbi:MAG: serine/threonine protein kinase [Micropruina sp.]|nr:serine/threonine protein kinase [Micropruina sp.]